MQEFIAKGIPLRGKAGTKWDIAIAAVFLATNAARFISGDTLVDGASWIYREPIMPREMVLATSKGTQDQCDPGILFLCLAVCACIGRSALQAHGCSWLQPALRHVTVDVPLTAVSLFLAAMEDKTRGGGGKGKLASKM